MNTIRKTQDERSEEQAAIQMDSIREMVEALHTKNEDKREQAETAIQEGALEVAIRENWHAPVVENHTGHTEYLILLCTGGPAVRITGDLNEHSEPVTAHLEHQDWGTPWTEYRAADEDILLEYARQFYFGE